MCPYLYHKMGRKHGKGSERSICRGAFCSLECALAGGRCVLVGGGASPFFFIPPIFFFFENFQTKFDFLQEQCL